MRIAVRGIQDHETGLIRADTGFGSLVATWHGPTLPMCGAILEVEVDLGMDQVKWGTDIVETDWGGEPSAIQSAGVTVITGQADYAGDRILYIRLAPDCLVALVLDTDLGPAREIGPVRVESRVLQFWPIDS